MTWSNIEIGFIGRDASGDLRIVVLAAVSALIHIGVIVIGDFSILFNPWDASYLCLLLKILDRVISTQLAFQLSLHAWVSVQGCDSDIMDLILNGLRSEFV